jgi:hypothetical protein
MSKGDKRRGNREAKKPKAPTKKVLATADFSKGESPIQTEKKKKK